MPTKTTIALVTLATLLGGATAPAFAQVPVAAPPPAVPPPQPLWAVPPATQSPPVWTRQPPASAIAPNGEYVAPLEQSTQPTYLPQSVALSGPRLIKDWEDGQPIPYGYHRETRARRGAIAGGAITFGIPYLFSAMVASIGSDAAGSGGRNEVGDLYMPVFGPFAQMSHTDSATANFFLLMDGVTQSLGAALFIYGMASPKPVLVRNDLAMVTVTPVRLGRDGNGVGVVGRF
jgi:hypothetical protein